MNKPLVLLERKKKEEFLLLEEKVGHAVSIEMKWLMQVQFP